MQRTNPTNLASLQHPFIVNYKANGKVTPHYRFLIHPLNPSPEYSVQDGVLRFETFNNFLDIYHFGVSVRESVYNKFNIQASIARNFNDMLKITENRRRVNPAFLTDYVIVDIPAKYFNEQSEVSSADFSSLNINENFIPNVQAYKYMDDFTGGIKYSIPEPNTTYPVYQQSIMTETIGSSFIYVAYNPKINVASSPNPLIKNGESVMHVMNYDKGAELEFGNDIVVSEHANLKSVAYRRKINALYDWCSHLEPKINRESYLKLTATSPDNITLDARHVAKLFDDYANKGSGFSALIHFHMFRHHENIQMARQIAQELKTDKFAEKNALDIADFLAEKFQELSKKTSINAEGSFARRINYCLLQLTGGMCSDVNSYLEYKQQFADTNECLIKIGNV